MLTMTRRKSARFLDLSPAAEAVVVAGARDCAPVKGLTHVFYKYPARFSPNFARAAIEAFTKPGDVCLDPYVGGGTSLVEAVALGRRGVGVDISALAEFVTSVKTTVFSEKQIEVLESWAANLPTVINAGKSATQFTNYAKLGYYKHLDHPNRWRLRKAIEQALISAIHLEDRCLEAFGRCAILRTAQWALDGRKTLPSLDEFRKALQSTALDMIAGAREFRTAISATDLPKPEVQVLNRSAAGIEQDRRLRGWKSPKLVLTSPPYPGVHVLYHRWQVDGRKETPLPFMIANKLDGAGSSYYTMGDRKYPELKTYFENISAVMRSVVALANEETIIVQMVAFAEPSWQLSKYLQAMSDSGLIEIKLYSLRDEADGRLWRKVPGRRWYSKQKGNTPASQEVVLFHRKAVHIPVRSSVKIFTDRMFTQSDA
jgi:hypothetical protein